MRRIGFSVMLGATVLLGLPGLSAAQQSGRSGHGSRATGISHAGVAHSAGHASGVSHAGVTHSVGHSTGLSRPGVVLVGGYLGGGFYNSGFNGGYYGYGDFYSGPSLSFPNSFRFGSSPFSSTPFSSGLYSVSSPLGPASYYAPRPAYRIAPVVIVPTVDPDANNATIEVHVPPDAELWLDGSPSSQRGEMRVFVVPLFQPSGSPCTYEFRVRWNQDGKPVEQMRQVALRASQAPAVDFVTR